jgi:hypothetical protein
MSGVIVYGNPHGDWKPLLRACAEDRPWGDFPEGNLHGLPA